MSSDQLVRLVGHYLSTPVSSNPSCRLEFPSSKSGLIGSPERSCILSQNSETPESLIFCIVPVIRSPLDLLLLLPDSSASDLGWIEGGSLRFWKTAALLAMEMVERGRYIPSIGTYRNGGFCTQWKITPSSYDSYRIDLLSRSMPPYQQRFLEYAGESSNPVKKRTSVILFLEAMISSIIRRSEQTDFQDPGSSFTPIERLKYAQELTALYYLQGYDRHKMPIASPQLTNGWKSKFTTWANESGLTIPDDLPWTVAAKVEELVSPSYDKKDEKNETLWALSFVIRSADDPNHLIRTGQYDLGVLPSVALPGEEELEKLLLTATTSVISISPALKVSSRTRFDPVITIPESDLIRFLTYDAPRISQSGLEIVYPDWWGRPKEPFQIRLSIRHREETKNSSLVGLQTLLNFDYRISVGDDRIDPTEFRRLVEQKTSTIRVGRRWVSIDKEHLDQIIQKTEKRFKKNKLQVADFLRLIARAETPGEPGVEAADTWTSNLLGYIRDGWNQTQIETPDSFCGVLRPYQMTGLSFLMTCRSIGFGACLADDMGLGKTPQTIAYLLAAKEQGLLCGPSLLICPTSIIGNWERELSRFSPSLTYLIHHGSSRLRGEQFIQESRNYDLIITSYALIYRDQDILSHLSYSTIILDEVQNIKNSHTKQFQAVRTLSSDHRIALTGTPVENHLSELWAIMEILNPEYLGSLSSFEKLYVTPIEKGGADEKAAELRRMIQPFLLRRIKTDTSVISDLPEKMEMQVFCSLTHEQAALYQATVNDLARDIHSLAGIARRGRILAALTRLKQICNYPDTSTSSIGDPERSGKVKRLIEMLEEIREEGDAAIIFTQYATFAQALAKLIHLSLKREVLLLTGSTPRHKREEMIARFTRPDGPQFFVISLRAGGTGLNLMRANHVFHIDRWWNPAVEDQATDRTYRIGQTRKVQVHMIVTAGTLEEQIHDMITRKRLIANQVITAGEEWLTELPTGELMDVLRLREQIFGDDI